jgi:gluconokinase
MAEQNPEEVFDAVIEVIRELVERCDQPAHVRALVFGGILHSVIPVDQDCKPMGRAIIWSDMRAREQCERLREQLDQKLVHARTGCPIHPLYLAPRLLWIGENMPVMFNQAARFISIKEYVLYRMFGEYVVDRSIASGTGLMNLHSLDWDADLLDHTGITRDKLSEIVDTDHRLTLKQELARTLGLPAHTIGIIGGSDGPLAHLGSVGTDPSYMSLTIGTSAALRKAVQYPTTVPGTEAWCYYMTENTWVVGGVIHDAGNLFHWFNERFMQEKPEEHVFDLLDHSYESIRPGSEGLFFLPFLSGERSPFYNPLANGAMIGMSFSHGPEHVVHAMAEGISYRIYSVYNALEPAHRADLVLTGGILRSQAWMRITADFLGRQLFRASHDSASAWGAALIAMRSLGHIDSMDEINDMVKPVPAVRFDEEKHSAYRGIQSTYQYYYGKLFT